LYNIGMKIFFQNLLNIANKYRFLLIPSIIILIAVFFRVWQIAVLPPGVSAGEVEIINRIRLISFENLWLGDKFYQGGYIYLGALAFKIFGEKVIVLRLLSALIGVATVFLSYVFISKWFTKQVAAFSSFLFAVSFFHVSVSRLILPELFLPFALLTLFIVLTDAYRNKNIWLFGLGGFIGGLGLYTSPAFLLMPILMIVSGIYFFFKNKKFITAYKQEIIVGLVAFLAASIPLIVSFFYHPASYLTFFGFYRNPMQIVINISNVAKMLFVATEPNYVINIGSEPLLDPFIYMTAIFGLFFALISIKRRKYFFIVFWAVTFSLYAILKRNIAIYDLIGLIPVVVTFSALILDYLLTTWFKTFPLNKRAQLLVILLISVFFALTSLYNYERYFVAYKNSPEVKEVFSAESPIPLK